MFGSTHLFRTLLTVAALMTAIPGFAFDTLDGNRARWRSMPVSYSINSHSPDVSLSDERAAIAAAFDAWANVSGASLSFRSVSNGQITVDFDRDWPREWGQEAAGITITNRNNNRISSAEVHFNNEYFQWSTSGAQTLTDIQGVATHEFGHAIGFDHSFYFESTMYWSGGDARLRTLAPDDERGIRFLYGSQDNQSGQMCDTCLSDSDCATYCLGLELNRSHCGQACTIGADCPPHSDCFELNNGARSCAPLAFACSDDPRLDGNTRLSLEAGDYCFGADQCRSGSLCLPLEDTAECIQSCNPNNNNCPGGAECYATGDPDNPGLCIPPGNVAEGGVCGTFQNRCQDGLECAYIGDRPRCFSYCEPGGTCASGFGCSPLDASRWVCLSNDGPQEGEPCENDLCAGGLTCLSGQNGPTCVPGCLPSDTNACGTGRRCFSIREGVGACSPGTIPDGDACSDNLDCRGGYCLFRGGARVCGRGCTNTTDCIDGESCERLNSGEQVCLPSNQTEPTNVADSGTLAPTPRDQFVGTRDDASVSSSGGNTGTQTPDSADGGRVRPTVFFDDQPGAEAGCQCKTGSSEQSPPMILMILLMFGLNGWRSRNVLKPGGKA